MYVDGIGSSEILLVVFDKITVTVTVSVELGLSKVRMIIFYSRLVQTIGTIDVFLLNQP